MRMNIGKTRRWRGGWRPGSCTLKVQICLDAADCAAPEVSKTRPPPVPSPTTFQNSCVTPIHKFNTHLYFLVFAARTAQSFILIFYVSGQTFLSKMSDCKISHFLLSSSCKSSKAVHCIVVQADQLKKSAAFMLSVPIPPYSSLFNPAITLDSSN